MAGVSVPRRRAAEVKEEVSRNKEMVPRMKRRMMKKARQRERERVDDGDPVYIGGCSGPGAAFIWSDRAK